MHTIFRTTSLYKQCLPVLSLKLLVSNFKALGLVCISSIKTNRVVLRSANGKKTNKEVCFLERSLRNRHCGLRWTADHSVMSEWENRTPYKRPFLVHQTVLNDTLLETLKTEFVLFQAKKWGIFLLIRGPEKRIWGTFYRFGKEGKSLR